MAQVIDLAQFRKEKMLAEAGVEEASPPVVADADIWGRDWSNFDNVMFGLLKVRELLEYHLPYDEAWKHYLLRVLDASYQARHAGQGKMDTALQELKAYVHQETDPINRKAMSIIKLLLDLIEKSSPAARSMRN